MYTTRAKPTMFQKGPESWLPEQGLHTIQQHYFYRAMNIIMQEREYELARKLNPYALPFVPNMSQETEDLGIEDLEEKRIASTKQINEQKAEQGVSTIGINIPQILKESKMKQQRDDSRTTKSAKELGKLEKIAGNGSHGQDVWVKVYKKNMKSKKDNCYQHLNTKTKDGIKLKNSVTKVNKNITSHKEGILNSSEIKDHQNKNRFAILEEINGDDRIDDSTSNGGKTSASESIDSSSDESEGYEIEDLSIISGNESDGENMEEDDEDVSMEPEEENNKTKRKKQNSTTDETMIGTVGDISTRRHQMTREEMVIELKKKERENEVLINQIKSLHEERDEGNQLIDILDERYFNETIACQAMEDLLRNYTNNKPKDKSNYKIIQKQQNQLDALHKKLKQAEESQNEMKKKNQLDAARVKNLNEKLNDLQDDYESLHKMNDDTKEKLHDLEDYINEKEQE